MAPWQKALAAVQNGNNGTLHEAQCQCCSMTCNRAMPRHGEKCHSMLLHKGTKKNITARCETKPPVPWPKKCSGMMHNTIANAVAQSKMPIQSPTLWHEGTHHSMKSSKKSHSPKCNTMAEEQCHRTESNTMAQREMLQAQRAIPQHEEQCHRHEEQHCRHEEQHCSIKPFSNKSNTKKGNDSGKHQATAQADCPPAKKDKC